MRRILIVEDNADLARGLRTNLVVEGFAVDWAPDAEKALVAALDPGLALIILDLMLPGRDGFEFLEALRHTGSDIPVLILSARGAETDKLRGFRAGADDYVTKPFGVRELVARVQAILRRAVGPTGAKPSAEPLRFADVEISEGDRQVKRGGAEVLLRPREFDLLVALARRRGAVVPRDELMRDVWGYQTGVHSRTLDTHIAELRRKLGQDPASPGYIQTVHKVGYRLKA